MVTDRFHIKPLLPILNGNGRFYILALSQQDIRFFEGTRYSVNEVEVENLPKSLDEALQKDDTAKEGQFRIATPKKGEPQILFRNQVRFTGKEALTGINTKKTSSNSFKLSIAHYTKNCDRQKAPLVLAGVDLSLPLYRQANTYQHLMDEAITGNPEILSAQELHDQAWPIVEADFQKSQQGFLEQFHELFGGDTGKASNNLTEIVSAAYYQRVDSLLVAVGQQQWGLLDPTSETVYLHPEKETGDEDLLDFVAATYLIKWWHSLCCPFRTDSIQHICCGNLSILNILMVLYIVECAIYNTNNDDNIRFLINQSLIALAFLIHNFYLSRLQQQK